LKRWLLCGVGAVSVGLAVAHGFDERYDLPVPMQQVVVGACAVVLLSFVVVALAGTRLARVRWGWSLHLPDRLLLVLRGVSLLLFVLTIAAALWGTRDPLMNLAPTLVWIVWWVGLSFISALLCNLWPALDPWRSSFKLLAGLARRCGAARPPVWRWPQRLGQWPAVALLLAWSWLEVVQPLASTPQRLGLAALGWTVLSWAGMGAFGRAVWQAHADPFAISFATLGRMAPLRLSMADAPPSPATAGQIAFVIAMLATVVFDGLHGGVAWNAFEAVLRALLPRGWFDVNGYLIGTSGLLAVWLGMLLAYVATLRISLWLLQPRPALACSFPVLPVKLALTLVPIAAAYNVAHNFSSLAIQGQNVFQLLSDPFGRQWDLFGTARWHPDIGMVDARLTWFVAVTAIVAGHVLAIAWSHREVLAAGIAPRRAALAMLPMTLLMLGYTAISLLLIGEPMVAPPR
jgi:hypothetical protein